MEFHNHSGTLVATGYRRLVKGGRGEYIEFDREHICWDEFEIPEAHKYRVEEEWKEKVYWLEYRTKDDSFTKLYEQLKNVKYADYLIGKFYISPALVNWEGGKLETTPI